MPRNRDEERTGFAWPDGWDIPCVQVAMAIGKHDVQLGLSPDLTRNEGWSPSAWDDVRKLAEQIVYNEDRLAQWHKAGARGVIADYMEFLYATQS